MQTEWSGGASLVQSRLEQVCSNNVVVVVVVVVAAATVVANLSATGTLVHYAEYFDRLMMCSITYPYSLALRGLNIMPLTTLPYKTPKTITFFR